MADPIVSRDAAIAHVREDASAPIDLYLSAATSYVVEYLDANIYPDAEAWQSDIDSIPADTYAADAAYDAAMQAAEGLPWDKRCAARVEARNAYLSANASIDRKRFGRVANDAIRAAILLVFGHLWKNRESVTDLTAPMAELPMGVYALLAPYRRGPSA